MPPVGILRRRRSEKTPVPVPPDGRRAFTVIAPPEITGQWNTATLVPRMNRDEALSVPAVLRSRNLIAGTLGAMPLHLHDPERTVVASPLLDQPEAGCPRSVTMAMLFEDLLFGGIGWWRITRFAWTGYPAKVVRVAPGEVDVHPDGTVWVRGEYVPDGELIRFDSPNPGLLTAAARAIRTCLKLDATAATYADNPMPLDVFTPAEGADPADDDEIVAMLDAWQAARKVRGSAYVPAALTRTQSMPMTAEQIQLADSRQHAVLEIARATGIDPEDLGVSTTSRTYQNDEQRRMAFIDFTLGPYVNAVQDRLSMGDVTPRGYYVRFSFDAFLRSDASTRMDVYAKGLAVGAYDRAEIRALEDKPALPAAQAAPTAPAGHRAADRRPGGDGLQR